MAQILVEFKNKLSYVWENTNITMQAFAQKIAIFLGGYSKYKEFYFSAADLATFDTNPFILLPELPANQYYETKAIVEYTHVTTPYLAAFNMEYVTSPVTVAGALVGTSAAYSNVQFIGPAVAEIKTVGAAIQLAAQAPVAAGDGTLKIKLWYTIHKLG